VDVIGAESEDAGFFLCPEAADAEFGAEADRA
jgi:hypothetical protein